MRSVSVYPSLSNIVFHFFCSFYAKELSVRLGFVSPTQNNSYGVSRNVLEIHSHECFNAITWDNDITLLKMDSPVPLSADIMPVCLAAPNGPFHSGTKAWITGWGRQGARGGSGSTLRPLRLIHRNSMLSFCAILILCESGV